MYIIFPMFFTYQEYNVYQQYHRHPNRILVYSPVQWSTDSVRGRFRESDFVLLYRKTRQSSCQVVTLIIRPKLRCSARLPAQHSSASTNTFMATVRHPQNFYRLAAFHLHSSYGRF